MSPQPRGSRLASGSSALNAHDPHENLLVPMRSSALGKRGQMVVRSEKCASLSVVVVSMGTPSDTRRATQTLGLPSRDLGAQLIVVSHDARPALARTVEDCGAEFVAAPPGSSRAEMCDLGMRHARGSIVVVRDDAAINDAGWLDAYRGVLGRRQAPAPIAPESVVMDTMVAGRTGLADGGSAYSPLESRGGKVSSVELASAT